MPAASRPLLLDPDSLPATGSYRGHRMPRALAEGYLQIDDKDITDWLAYIVNLSRHLAFVDTDGSRRGHWGRLYTGQPVVVTALLSRFDTEGIARELSDLGERIEDNTATPSARRELLTDYFERLRTAVARLDGLIAKLPPGGALARRAASVVTEGLAADYARWKSYLLTAIHHGIADLPAPYATEGALALALRNEPLTDSWHPAALDADRLGVFGLDGPPVDDDARARAAVYAVGHTFVSGVISAFVQKSLHLRAAAQIDLQRLLNEHAGHAPHLTAVLAFLRVREHQRTAINGLADRHLRYYYERVLRLRPAPAQPRRAYLTHELRKNTAPILLPAGTHYRGGKDPSTGRERLFASQTALTVSAAAVTDLRHLDIDKLDIGFAIADPVLEAAGGTRTYTLTLGGNTIKDYAASHWNVGWVTPPSGVGGPNPGEVKMASGMLNDLNGSQLRCSLTTEEGWHTTIINVIDGKIEIVVEAEVPPVVANAEAAAEWGLPPELPLLHCVFVGLGTNQYHRIRREASYLEALRLSVTDITEAERPGGGLIKLEEKFYPFGGAPGGGETFELRLPEARRKGARVEVGVEDIEVDHSYRIDPVSAIGAVKLTAAGEWPHATYPQRLAQSIIDSKPPDAPPKAPVVNSLSLTYSVEKKCLARYLHLTPFGYVLANEENPLLPEVLPGWTLGADAGAVYIGIQQWEAGTQLSLLVTIANGSVDPEASKPQDHISWDYLNGNTWTSFPGDKIDDGTNQLLATGLVRLDLPPDTDPANTRMGDGRMWLRIGWTEAPRAKGRMEEVHTHAVEVREIFDETGPPPLMESLEAETINKLAEKRTEIAKVVQPYATFGGAGVESRDAFFARASERLRHRGRGVMLWDVERLVLAYFPEVERVICLPHLRYGAGLLYDERAAGHVTVLPLAGNGGRVSLDTRERITNFLRGRMSCHATLHVKPPVYEEVTVTATVQMHEGTDWVWANAEISRRLVEFLSPWRTAGTAALDFAATVRRAAVIDFIEELPFVDTVDWLSLSHEKDSQQKGRETLRPTRQVAVLVSASSHRINTGTA